MAIITLTSDYGSNTYYTAALKAAIWSKLSDVQIVDISHHIPPFDLLQSAFLLQNCLNEFKTPTIHFIAVDTALNDNRGILIARIGTNWIISVDNGFLSMLGIKPDEVYSLHKNQIGANELFPEKNIFPQLAQWIIERRKLNEFADYLPSMATIANLSPAVEPLQIRATIVHIDGYENLITNLNKTDFYQWLLTDRFRIYFKRKEYITQINLDFNASADGNVYAIFNQNNWLQIGVLKGKGKSLLGLKVGEVIIIDRII